MLLTLLYLYQHWKLRSISISLNLPGHPDDSIVFYTFAEEGNGLWLWCNVFMQQLYKGIIIDYSSVSRAIIIWTLYEPGSCFNTKRYFIWWMSERCYRPPKTEYSSGLLDHISINVARHSIYLYVGWEPVLWHPIKRSFINRNGCDTIGNGWKADDDGL